MFEFPSPYGDKLHDSSTLNIGEYPRFPSPYEDKLQFDIIRENSNYNVFPSPYGDKLQWQKLLKKELYITNLLYVILRKKERIILRKRLFLRYETLK